MSVYRLGGLESCMLTERHSSVETVAERYGMGTDLVERIWEASC